MNIMEIDIHMVHGIGLCDEWPQIRYPTDGGEQGGSFEKNMTTTLESYIGKVGGKEGVKLEQQYLIGENGLRVNVSSSFGKFNESCFNGITWVR